MDMKGFIAFLLAASFSWGETALAQVHRASPLLGSWAVDVSRLTITFSDAGGGKWTAKVDILGGDGSERHMTSTYALDGTPAGIQGDTTEADVGAVKTPAPNVMVLELAKGGVPASTRVYTVAPDGKTMIETAAYAGPDGKPFLRTNYFNRIK
jgi:hypothetical protein